MLGECTSPSIRLKGSLRVSAARLPSLSSGVDPNIYSSILNISIVVYYPIILPDRGNIYYWWGWGFSC